MTANTQGTGTITCTRGQGSTQGQAFAANATLTPVFDATGVNIAFARLDQATTQAFSGAITVPPSGGAAVPATSYGSFPIKLAEASGDGATNGITFSGIPTTFRTLIVEVFGRATNAVTNNALQVQLNGDTTGVYEWNRSNAAGGDFGAGSAGTGDTSMTLGYVNGTTAPANAVAHTRLEIAFANSVIFDKAVTGQGTVATAYSASNTNAVVSSGVWHNATVAAVTSIKLITAAGFFTTTSLAFLYGIP